MDQTPSNTRALPGAPNATVLVSTLANRPAHKPAPKPAESLQTLKILILEDQLADAEQISELAKAGLDFIAERVATRGGFTGALGTFAPDVGAG